MIITNFNATRIVERDESLMLDGVIRNDPDDTLYLINPPAQVILDILEGPLRPEKLVIYRRGLWRNVSEVSA